MPKEITAERLREVFELNAETGEVFRKVKSANQSRIRAIGFDSSAEYPNAGIDGTSIKLHRVAFALHYGYLPEIVDHINGNKRDNRPCNLRAVTRQQNSMNRVASSAKRDTAYKGVTLLKNGMWRASIGVNGKTRDLGVYATDVEAAIAYDFASRLLHGEHGKRNFDRGNSAKDIPRHDPRLWLVAR